MTLTLLVGLVANALLGWWWLDAVTALLLVPWLVREGFEGIRGEDHHDDLQLCSCRSCLLPCVRDHVAAVTAIDPNV